MVRDSSLHRENRHHWDRICCEKDFDFFQIFFIFKFFFSSYFFIVFWGWTLFFSNLMARLKLITKKIGLEIFFFWKIWNFFFILVRCFFFLVTTFKFGLFSSFFIGSAAKTTNSILNFFSIFLRDCWSIFFRSRGCFREQKMWCYFS